MPELESPELDVKTSINKGGLQAISVPDETPKPEPIKIPRFPYLLNRQRIGSLVPVQLAVDLPRNWEKKCRRKLRKGSFVHLVEVSEWLVSPTQVDKQFLFLEGVREGLSLRFGQFIPPKPSEKKPTEATPAVVSQDANSTYTQ